MFSDDNIKVIKKYEKKFPKQLYDLRNCPEHLYTIGNTSLLSKFSLAVIGARKCEYDSKKCAEKISYGLAKIGAVIISGMAHGIDSVAHESCLKANGKTIAVLGGGFNYIYPKENIELFYKILEDGGLVISEYSPDEPPLRHHFLERNRIVAALSKGVVLIEAKENSGSITTAKYALQLKRKLFILPGAVTNTSFAGSNQLLMNGGKCILNYQDIVKEYKQFSKIKVDNSDFDNRLLTKVTIPEEYIEIYKVLSNKPKTANQISLESQIPMHQLNSKLTLMEMEGYVNQLPGKLFIKV